MANLIGREVWSNNNKVTSQVYQATHDGAGNSLPYMSRSFISFTFGGKAIEDFGLIVITDGDRIEKDAYSSFSDLTSTYDTLNGQLYWGSKIEPNKLELRLATDGITEQQLDNFREWFAPEKERELILSEHPNRAIKARVAAAPVFSLLPFEKNITVKINSVDYETSTTVYRGEVSLSFIMDEPFWYAKLNYMPTYINKKTLEKLEYDSESNDKVNALQDKDMLKIMVEDGIPHQSTLSTNMFLGGNLLVTREARIGSALIDHAYLGNITEGSSGLSVSNNNPQYLFYSGTAKSYPIIKFTINPTFDFSVDKINPGYTARYVKSPKNSFSNTNYSYIKIGDNYFYFTTPSIITGVNEALNLFKQFPTNTACADLIKLVQENIHERYSRAWAVACINSLKDANNNKITKITTQPQRLFLLNNMMAFLVDTNSIIPNLNINEHDSSLNNSVIVQVREAQAENNLPIFPMTFIINSKTGEAIGFFTVRVADSNGLIDDSSFSEIEQNVGDMVRSDYLTIEGRNYLNSNGGITIANCKKIQSNESLTDVLVFFQNMYL